MMEEPRAVQAGRAAQPLEAGSEHEGASLSSANRREQLLMFKMYLTNLRSVYSELS